MPSPARLSGNVFRYRSFLALWIGRLMTSNAIMAQSVTIGWQVYSIARKTHSIEQSAFLVGMVGLVQFLPMFAFSLLAGEAADRYERKFILVAANVLQAISAAGLLLVSLDASGGLLPVFLIAALFGIARAFLAPASQSITPMLVPFRVLPRAIAWNALSFQAGMITGPWAAGLLCAISPSVSYGFSCILYAASTIAFMAIRANTKPQHNGLSRAALIREGLDYLWSNKLVFGAISLDLFVVLLGSAAALLPVFARDILHIGPEGFGWLRSASAVGSGLMTLHLSFRPIRRNAGRWLFLSTAVYGAMTLVFALSKELWLSLVALAFLGAADSVSVFIRQSLVQIVTPDRFRGRVSAVSGLFVAASNDLGEFESGVMARLLGPVGSAIFGGLGSILVTVIWGRLFPALRKADRLIET